MRPYPYTLIVAILPILLARQSEGRRQMPPAEQFRGSTPCDASPRRFLGIPPDSPCDRISWALDLYQARNPDGAPRYSLIATYGLLQQNTPGFAGGGTKVHVKGTWSTSEGIRSLPAGRVYTIATEAPTRYARFARIGDRLLHLLTEDTRLMVGNPFWSYTLNRVGAVPTGAGSLAFANSAQSPGNAAGVFEGRTPCQELAKLLQVRTSSDCNKIKWRLTLRQDERTGTPTTYTLEGFVYRKPARTGPWGTLRDPRTQAIIYRLDPERPGGFVSLLAGDGNVLFFMDAAGELLIGDSEHSYTLNRVSDDR